MFLALCLMRESDSPIFTIFCCNYLLDGLIIAGVRVEDLEMLRRNQNAQGKIVQQVFSMSQRDLGRIVTLAYSTKLYTRD